MSLRIPSDASTQVQQAFRELDDRTKNSVDIDTVKQLIQQSIKTIKPVNIPKNPTSIINNNYPDINEIMRPSGPSHIYGFVPDPGASIGSDAVLHEDALWKQPLSGNLQDVSDFDSKGPIKKYLLNGGLIINGPLITSDFFCGTITKLGGLPIITIASAANVSTGETTLLSAQLPAGVLSAVGTGLKISATLTFAGNANSKTVKAVFGATSVSLGTLAYNGVRGIITVYILYNTATTQRIFANINVFGNPTAERSTAAETAANSILFKFTGTGGASSDIIMDEMVIEGIGVP